MPVSESQETAKTRETLLLFCLFQIQNTMTAASDIITKSKTKLSHWEFTFRCTAGTFKEMYKPKD